MNDLDFSSSMNRDTFEELSASLIERAKAPIMQVGTSASLMHALVLAVQTKLRFVPLVRPRLLRHGACACR